MKNKKMCKELKRTENGITLIALAITIIVLMIILSIGTYSGINSLKEAKEDKLLSELGMMQQVILENYTKYLMLKDNTYIIGTKLEYEEVQNVISEINKKSTETVSLKLSGYTSAGDAEYYYRLSPEDYALMGLSDMEDTYIVNYKTGEVINESVQTTITGKPLYLYSM